jgi:hypothetical protein
VVKTFVAAVLASALYLLPWIIAASRDHHRRSAIFWLDVLLGWTVLGWIAALVWSLRRTEGRTAIEDRRLRRASGRRDRADPRPAPLEEFPAFLEERPRQLGP